MADDRSLRLSCGGNGGRVLGCSNDSIFALCDPNRGGCSIDSNFVFVVYLLSPLGASLYHEW